MSSRQGSGAQVSWIHLRVPMSSSSLLLDTVSWAQSHLETTSPRVVDDALAVSDDDNITLRSWILQLALDSQRSRTARDGCLHQSTDGWPCPVHMRHQQSNKEHHSPGWRKASHLRGIPIPPDPPQSASTMSLDELCACQQQSCNQRDYMFRCVHCPPVFLPHDNVQTLHTAHGTHHMTRSHFQHEYTLCKHNPSILTV